MTAASSTRMAMLITLCGALGACGGGGSGAASTSSSSTSTTSSPPPASPPPPANPPPTAIDAARLLEQATFGPTAADVAHVQSVGVDAYIAEQLAAPASQYTGFSYVPHTALAACQTDAAAPTSAASLCHRDNYSTFQVDRQFFLHALNDADQLRQRVAFALSQIFVVSSTEVYEAYGMANYQNLLLNDAFGNYRALLEDVTLSPEMGRYLDMASNAKSDPVHGTSPNENYGREVLQLFSIGLYQLNADGTQKTDSSGAAIPTYDENTVGGFSAVFTGWDFAPRPGGTAIFGYSINYDGAMVLFADQHQTGTKALLDGLTLPDGQTPQADLKSALDDIFNHPNVGPFIGMQLIQHLVTSNPSPAYVARISAVFANNGSGVRGDLGAVVKAILSDPEARGDAPSSSSFGHLREPALFVAAAVRSLGGKSDGELLSKASAAMGQPVFSAPSVFNYYPPSFVLPGTQTLAPEFFIHNAATALARANFVNTLIVQGGAKPDASVSGAIGTSIDLTTLAASNDPITMIRSLNTSLMHGSLSSQASAVILAALQAQGAADPLAQARTASYLMLTSAQYEVER